jgi:hypothetical protein
MTNGLQGKHNLSLCKCNVCIFNYLSKDRAFAWRSCSLKFYSVCTRFELRPKLLPYFTGVHRGLLQVNTRIVP